MSKITFILGGARSGKSLYAAKLALNSGNKVLYVATGVPCDEEMKIKIEKHKKERPESWETIEEPVDIKSVIKNIDNVFDIVIIECLSFWISNLFFQYKSKEKDNDNEKILKNIMDYVIDTFNLFKNLKTEIIVVSNEVGMGIVPDNEISRVYRDILGKTNQMMAECAENVFLIVAGISIKIK
ncbi:MAG: bifunctional adenosylcobinamide kinase/adenosylcobinamide-phosphate guanylyltransferase [Candidatus Firestonebacteria bacterium]|nr:bifunctional adenosylcobinamide kinase/adenosylcobinamide-phosphate guanylyltransferase [Candidatus Firestonebacteria bacterium]